MRCSEAFLPDQCHFRTPLSRYGISAQVHLPPKTRLCSLPCPSSKPAHRNMPQSQGVVGRGGVLLQSRIRAERRKMTAFQGIFQSEGTRDGRGPQQHTTLAGYADRSPHQEAQQKPRLTPDSNSCPARTEYDHQQPPQCPVNHILPITRTCFCGNTMILLGIFRGYLRHCPLFSNQQKGRKDYFLPPFLISFLILTFIQVTP